MIKDDVNIENKLENFLTNVELFIDAGILKMLIFNN